MMKTTNNVTLPTAETLKDKAIPLSYYSQLLGARSVHTTNLVTDELTAAYGDQNYEFGEIWLSTLGNNLKEVQTYTWRDAHIGGVHLHSRDVFNQHVGVLPCFNASEDGVDVRLVDGENLLTFKGEVTNYPQSPVSAAMRKELFNAYNLMVSEHDRTMKLVGGFTRPVYYDYEQQKYQMQQDLCYNYKGKNYVRVLLQNGTCEWVNCEPIKAYKTADNLVLPKQTLLAGSFDQPEEYFAANYMIGEHQTLDVQHYGLGKFLNNELIENLRNSTGLNQHLLTQPKTRFGRGLKGNTANNERNR